MVGIRINNKKTKNFLSSFNRRKQAFASLESGQTIVAIFFVMIAALAIGVSVSNRFVTNTRSVTRSQTSYRALGVAEAGIERMLVKPISELEDYITYNNCGSECLLQITNADGVVETATITLSYLGNTSESFEFALKQDATIEVNLSGYPDDDMISVCWNDPGELNPPAIVGGLVYGSIGNYQFSNFAVNSTASTITNNFTQAVAANGFESCFNVPTYTNPQVLRLKSVYTDVEVSVLPSVGASLPIQGILIESTGTVLDSTRQVSVIRSSNQTPTLFDYVIYSKSDTNPLAN